MLTQDPGQPKSLKPAIRLQGDDVKVRSYGKLADLLGPERELTIGASCSIAELRAYLAAEYPDAAEALGNERVRACVDDELVPDDHIVGPGGIVEFLAPVSGG